MVFVATDNDIDKLEKIIDALSEHFPYDKRVDEFKTMISQIKKKMDLLHHKVADFMKKERIIHESV